MEIERKFLVGSLPEGLDEYRRADLIQTYLSLGNDGAPERRIRSVTAYGNTIFYLTEKGSGTLVREENERELGGDEYAELKRSALTAEVEKTRYYVPLGGSITAELDVFHGRLSGLMTVEVEFESVKAAESFTPPAWFGKEVTQDSRYKNKALALFGMPTP